MGGLSACLHLGVGNAVCACPVPGKVGVWVSAGGATPELRLAVLLAAFCWGGSKLLRQQTQLGHGLRVRCVRVLHVRVLHARLQRRSVHHAGCTRRAASRPRVPSCPRTPRLQRGRAAAVSLLQVAVLCCAAAGRRDAASEFFLGGKKKKKESLKSKFYTAFALAPASARGSSAVVWHGITYPSPV